MKLTFHYFIILLLFFCLLTPTLHAKTDHVRNNKAAPLDVDQEVLEPSQNITRRINKKLRFGIPKRIEFDELSHVRRNSITNYTIVIGYCVDVFLAAIRGLKYEIDYEFIPFIDEKGNMAGTYDEFVYQIHLQKYDAVVGDVTITADRSKYVDFTLPFTDIGVGTLVKTVYQKDMWIFLKPLNKNLWIASLVFFIFTGFIVWAIEHPSNSEFQGSPSQQIGTVFWFTFSTLVFAHRETMTRNLSKFVVIVWVFVVLVLTSSYTATLASLLTVQQIQWTTSTPQWALTGYQSIEEYADDLLRGSKHGGTDIIIDEIPYIKLFLAMYPDGYTLVKSTPITNGFGFAFAKGSPLVFDVSREIAKLRETGELMKIQDKWFKSKINEPDSNNPKTLDFYSFGGLFLVTGLSSTLALVIFLSPKIYRYSIKLVKIYTKLLKIYIFKFLEAGILPVR